MAKELKIKQENVVSVVDAVNSCPFDAIEEKEGKLEINAGCKMCGVCTKKLPNIFYFEETKEDLINKDEWQGTAIFIEHENNIIHPVSIELIGKAIEFREKINQKVMAVVIGNNTENMIKEVLQYGVDEVYVYDNKLLSNFDIEPYANAFADFVSSNKPNIILVGGTNLGRSLAPRIATRFKTGLTADCTILDVQKDGSLDQIRPAFGGNIMAHIYTPNHRPQLATVRYKIFNKTNIVEPFGEVINCSIDDSLMSSSIKVLKTYKKEVTESIEDAEIIVACGNIFKNKEELQIAYDLAEVLGGKVACTRPLIENGWFDPRLQIGLSGRTVRPKLIITLGVSGAIQFTAGMNGSEKIIAINEDENAQIFDCAHVALVGDVFEIVPKLLEQIKA